MVNMQYLRLRLSWKILRNCKESYQKPYPSGAGTLTISKMQNHIEYYLVRPKVKKKSHPHRDTISPFTLFFFSPADIVIIDNSEHRLKPKHDHFNDQKYFRHQYSICLSIESSKGENGEEEKNVLVHFFGQTKMSATRLTNFIDQCVRNAAINEVNKINGKQMKVK